MQPLAHFKTITHHRHLVCRYCFRLGLYRQGLLHDLSKYAPCEFWRGAKYYQGYRSPNDAERKQNGVSLALSLIHILADAADQDVLELLPAQTQLFAHTAASAAYKKNEKDHDAGGKTGEGLRERIAACLLYPSRCV